MFARGNENDIYTIPSCEASSTSCTGGGGGGGSRAPDGGGGGGGGRLAGGGGGGGRDKGGNTSTTRVSGGGGGGGGRRRGGRGGGGGRASPAKSKSERSAGEVGRPSRPRRFSDARRRPRGRGRGPHQPGRQQIGGRRCHARRSPRGRDNSRGRGADRAARAWGRAPGHRMASEVLAKRASRAPRPRDFVGERVNREYQKQNLRRKTRRRRRPQGPPHRLSRHRRRLRVKPEHRPRG